jgi:hypothetical protein
MQDISFTHELVKLRASLIDTRTASLAFGGGFVAISTLRARHLTISFNTCEGIRYSLKPFWIHSHEFNPTYQGFASVAIPVAVKFWSWLARFEMGRKNQTHVDWVSSCRLHRVQYLVWSRLLCNVPFFDPKHKLVWIGQFANIGTRIPGTSGNTSTVGVIRDAKATWNNLNFPDALLAKKRF